MPRNGVAPAASVGAPTCSGSRKRAASEAAAHVTYEDISKLFGLSLAKAAASIGVGRTLFKKVCRREGIEQWPQRAKDEMNSSAPAPLVLQKAHRVLQKPQPAAPMPKAKPLASPRPKDTSVQRPRAKQQDVHRSMMTVEARLDNLAPNRASALGMLQAANAGRALDGHTDNLRSCNTPTWSFTSEAESDEEADGLAHEICSSPVQKDPELADVIRNMENSFSELSWLTALEPDNEPETESTINGTYAYPAAESEATAMHLGDQLLCEPAPSSGEGLANLSNVDPLVAPAALVSVGQQEASGSTGDGLLATALAMPEPSTSGDSTSAACPQMPMQKNTTTPSECKSPVVSPCLSPSAASSMPDGIEYLDLNDGEMEKWPGVDPESRYQSALDYPVV